MSDLFVTGHTPTLGVGRALRSYAIIRALANLGPVDVLYIRFGADEPSREYLGVPNIRLHRVEPSRGAGRIAAFAGELVRGTPQQLARVVSPELVAAARRLAPAPGTGRIIADHGGIHAALRCFDRSHGVIMNSHNLESAFQDDLDAESLGSARALAKFERRMFQRSPETWMVSHADIAGARRLAPGARFRYVPNVVDTAAITPVSGPPAGRRALLVANYVWPPNRHAVRFLLDDVMPRVWAELPDARLCLVGKGLELGDDVDPRVERLGFVED